MSSLAAMGSKGAGKTEEVGSLAMVAGQLQGDEFVGLLSLWLYLRRQRACVCCGEWMSLASFPRRESGKRQDAYP